MEPSASEDTQKRQRLSNDQGEPSVYFCILFGPQMYTQVAYVFTSGLQRSTRTSASEAVDKVVAAAEDVIASPVSAIKQSRLSKSVGATATSPSPPKTRSRATPKKA